MPVINRVAEFADEVVGWRRDFHVHPELMYDVHWTAGRVAELLGSFGVDEVATGIGKTGVVGVIRGRGPGRTIGLRADMDALPITERTGKAYQSQNAGRMHACGHDGHMAMLLGAARYLAETRNFNGAAVLIFQPAEEGGAGGLAMVEDGLMERFGVEEVYGLHNIPGIPAGHFGTRQGSIMAAADVFNITVEGADGHAAAPHRTTDPVVIAGHLIVALQSIVSRNVDPLQAAVLSVTVAQAGEAFNIIPATATLRGTVRTLDEGVRDLVEARLRRVVEGVAGGFGARAQVDYLRDYPVLVNTGEEASYAARMAAEVVGSERVNADVTPILAADDFAFMLQARPRRFRVPWQRHERQPAHRQVRFQRRDHPGGDQLLGEAGRRGDRLARRVAATKNSRRLSASGRQNDWCM